MATRTLTAVFDDLASAERASRELATKVTGLRGTIGSAGTGLAGMNDLGIPPDQALRSGAVTLTVELPESAFSTAAAMLEQCGAVELDAHEEEWRGEGWLGGTETPGASPAGTTDSDAAPPGSDPSC